MLKYLAVSVAMLLMASGCSVRQYRPQVGTRAYAQEELIVRLPAARVTAFIELLQKFGSAQPGTNLNATQWQGAGYEPQAATGAAYTAAFDDASRKAQIIAGRIHSTLGTVQSVTEFLGSTPANVSKAVLSAAPAHVMVGGDRTVTLAVVYGLANGGSLAVFGLSDAAAHGAAQGVSVSINSSGTTLDEARRRLADADTGVRDVARRFGVGNGSISITGAGFNRY